MKQILFIIFFSFAYFFSLNNAHATHIIGGEMNYKCLGNNMYEITLTVYRDCYNGVPPFDNPAHIGIFDRAYNLVDSIELKLNPDDTIKAILNDTCLVVPENVCVHTTTYKGIIELQPKLGGYILAYQRCCRNNTIVNIVNPQATGATFSVVITEDALNICNTSAKFKNWPPIFICVNEQIKFDHSAFDLDGDSVFYRICTPFNGGAASQANPQPFPSDFDIPFTEITWKAPYSLNNILGGTPLKIDSKTGELTGLPNTIGQFVVGICAEEYRNGVLISTNRRDFQYNVGICGSAGAAIFAPQIQCDDLNVKFINQSTNSSKFIWDFGLANVTNDTSTIKSPTFTYPKEGTYTVRLIASPGSACADTSYHTIKLSTSTLTPDFDFTIGDCSDSLTVNAFDKSTDPSGAPVGWEWKMYLGNDTLKSNLQNPILKPFKAGFWQLELTAIAKNGCPKKVVKDVKVELIDVVVKDTVRACIGEDVILIAKPGKYTYSWSPASEFADPTIPTQTALVTPSPKTYIAEISNSICKTTKKIVVAPDKTTPILKITANPDTIFLGKTSQLEATSYPGNYTYTWSPSTTLSSDKLSNPIAAPKESTTYSLTLTPSGGNCIAVAEVRVFVKIPDCDEPYIFIPNAFTPNNDGNNDILYVRGPIKKLVFFVYNRWGEKVFESTDPNSGWDGYIATTELPPDVYGYYLEIVCFDDKVFKKKGNINLIR